MLITDQPRWHCRGHTTKPLPSPSVREGVRRRRWRRWALEGGAGLRARATNLRRCARADGHEAHAVTFESGHERAEPLGELPADRVGTRAQGRRAGEQGRHVCEMGHGVAIQRPSRAVRNALDLLLRQRRLSKRAVHRQPTAGAWPGACRDQGARTSRSGSRGGAGRPARHGRRRPRDRPRRTRLGASRASAVAPACPPATEL